jgi:hypothetical protein
VFSGAVAPASAADLGGNCCADLEERIAELEATTVRKGNRKVSVTLSGYVSHHVMWWDDGNRSDTYIGDGGNYGSRFRFRGEAKISPMVTAGFLYEWQSNSNQIGSMNAFTGGDDLGATGSVSYTATNANAACGQTSGAGCTTLRDSTVWLRHSQLGMIKVGHGSTATDNLVLIDLGGMSGASTPDIGLYNGGFTAALGGGGYSAGTWGQLINGGTSWDTARRNHVMYETPTLAGFSVQAAVGEDNYWDVALRYAGEHHGFRVAFGVGYQEDTEFNAPNGVEICATNCNRRDTEFKGSASILHVASGLFLTGAAGTREIEDKTPIGANANFDVNFWYLAGGIAKNWTGLGNTVLFAEYSEHNDMVRINFSDPSSEVTHWGLGVVQYVDAAAMEVFLTYKNFEASTTTAPDLEDFSVVIGGARVSF